MKITAAPPNPIQKLPPMPWTTDTAPPVEEPFVPLPVAVLLLALPDEVVEEVVFTGVVVAGVVVAGVVVASGLLVLPSPLPVDVLVDNCAEDDWN